MAVWDQTGGSTLRSWVVSCIIKYIFGLVFVALSFDNCEIFSVTFHKVPFSNFKLLNFILIIDAPSSSSLMC